MCDLLLLTLRLVLGLLGLGPGPLPLGNGPVSCLSPESTASPAAFLRARPGGLGDGACVLAHPLMLLGCSPLPSPQNPNSRARTVHCSTGLHVALSPRNGTPCLAPRLPLP